MTGGDDPRVNPAAPPSNRPNRARLLVACGIIAAVLVGGSWAWQARSHHEQATKIRTLTSQVEQSMQNTFDTDPKFSKYRLQVQKVSLVRESGSKYDGIATVRSRGGEHEVMVEVVDDGSSALWHTSPGAFMFLVQEDLSSSATRGYAATGDLRAVQTLLGHTSVSTTQIYVACDDDSARAAMLAAVS